MSFWRAAMFVIAYVTAINLASWPHHDRYSVARYVIVMVGSGALVAGLRWNELE
jgi:hypothetical protein